MLKILKHIKRVISYKKYVLLLKLLEKNTDNKEESSNYVVKNKMKILAFLDKENVFMFLETLSIETLKKLLNTKIFYYKFRKKLDLKKLLKITETLNFIQLYNIFSKYYNYHCYKQFFEDLIKYRMIDYIISNLSYIKNGVSFDKIMSNLKSIKYELNDSQIDEITDEIIKSIIDLSCLNTLPNYRENIDFVSIRIIFNEILKNEGKSIFDLDLIGHGSFSTVYNIGDKVIKSGSRFADRIPDDERLLASIINREFYVEGSFNESVFIEITEIVDPLSENIDLSTDEKKEIVYSIYKELKERGKTWADPRINNVGILRKDNKVYFDGIDSVDKESLGCIKETIYDYETLKAGDYVILDRDIIYLDEDFSYKKVSRDIDMSRYDEMEKRYQKEIKNINKKANN